MSTFAWQRTSNQEVAQLLNKLELVEGTFFAAEGDNLFVSIKTPVQHSDYVDPARRQESKSIEKQREIDQKFLDDLVSKLVVAGLYKKESGGASVRQSGGEINITATSIDIDMLRYKANHSEGKHARAVVSQKVDITQAEEAARTLNNIALVMGEADAESLVGRILELKGFVEQHPDAAHLLKHLTAERQAASGRTT